jgi:hypothetical protein
MTAAHGNKLLLRRRPVTGGSYASSRVGIAYPPNQRVSSCPSVPPWVQPGISAGLLLLKPGTATASKSPFVIVGPPTATGIRSRKTTLAGKAGKAILANRVSCPIIEPPKAMNFSSVCGNLGEPSGYNSKLRSKQSVEEIKALRPKPRKILPFHDPRYSFNKSGLAGFNFRSAAQ